MEPLGSRRRGLAVAALLALACLAGSHARVVPVQSVDGNAAPASDDAHVGATLTLKADGGHEEHGDDHDHDHDHEIIDESDGQLEDHHGLMHYHEGREGDGASKARHTCVHDTYVVPEMMKNGWNGTTPHPQDVHGFDHDEKERHGRFLAEASPAPFRVVADYHWSSGVSSDLKAMLEKNVMPVTIAYLKRVLSIRHPESGKLKLQPRCASWSTYSTTPPRVQCNSYSEKCFSITLPSAHMNKHVKCGDAYDDCTDIPGGAGIDNADFVIYVSADLTDVCAGGSTLAYASFCTLDAFTDRPTSGMVNFCPNKYDPVEAATLQGANTWISTAIHEIMHTIGFSSSSYPYWRDAAGNARTPRKDNVQAVYKATSKVDSEFPTVKDDVPSPFGWSKIAESTLAVTQARGHSVRIIKTPAVVREARKHFGCNSMEGLELENHGGTGTGGSHWDERIMRADTMTGRDDEDPVTSPMTLALFEDTGFFLPNYEAAGKFNHGRDAGCTFVNGDCSSGNVDAFKPFFTDKPADPSKPPYGCLADHNFGYVRSCETAYGADGFPSSTSDSCWSDGCSYFNRFAPSSGGGCQDPSQRHYSNEEKWGRHHGKNSRCISDTPGKWKIQEGNSLYSRSAYGGSCMNTRCERNAAGGYKVFVDLGSANDGDTVECFEGGQDVSLVGKKVSSTRTITQGNIICPNPAEFCKDHGCPNDCNGFGNCFEGKCYCRMGRTGEDCSENYCWPDDSIDFSGAPDFLMTPKTCPSGSTCERSGDCKSTAAPATPAPTTPAPVPAVGGSNCFIATSNYPRECGHKSYACSLEKKWSTKAACCAPGAAFTDGCTTASTSANAYATTPAPTEGPGYLSSNAAVATPAPAPATSAPVAAPEIGAGPADTIDVLVVWSTAANAAISGLSGKITTALNSANTVLANSGLSKLKFKLAGTMEWKHAERAAYQLDVAALQADPAVRAKRDEMAADIVIAMVHNPTAELNSKIVGDVEFPAGQASAQADGDTCGMAWKVGNFASGWSGKTLGWDAENAYAVVSSTAACLNANEFARKAAHLLGLLPDVTSAFGPDCIKFGSNCGHAGPAAYPLPVSDAVAPNAFGYQYVDLTTPANSFRDIMAGPCDTSFGYDTGSPGCPQQMVFSNPARNPPTGDAHHDAATQLLWAWPFVARYRGTPSNVWPASHQPHVTPDSGAPTCATNCAALNRGPCRKSLLLSGYYSTWTNEHCDAFSNPLCGSEYHVAACGECKPGYMGSSGPSNADDCFPSLIPSTVSTTSSDGDTAPAVDGDPTTAWKATGQAFVYPGSTSITIDLKAIKRSIKYITIDWALYSYHPKSFKVAVATQSSASSYQDVFSVSGEDWDDSLRTVIRAPVFTEARFIRVYDISVNRTLDSATGGVSGTLNVTTFGNSDPDRSARDLSDLIYEVGVYGEENTITSSSANANMLAATSVVLEGTLPYQEGASGVYVEEATVNGHIAFVGPNAGSKKDDFVLYFQCAKINPVSCMPGTGKWVLGPADQLKDLEAGGYFMGTELAFIPDPDSMQCTLSACGHSITEVLGKWQDISDDLMTTTIYDGLDMNVRGVAQPAVTSCYRAFDKGTTYEGTVSTTENGNGCKKWSDRPNKDGQNGTTSVITAYSAMYGSINHCRNPDNSDRPWCWADKDMVRWEYCTIPQCDVDGNPLTGDPPAPITFAFPEMNGAASGAALTSGDNSTVTSYTTPVERVTIDGVACMIPFLYGTGDDQFTYYDCTGEFTSDGTEWCCTGSNCEEEWNWCASNAAVETTAPVFERKTVDGKVCELPFQYGSDTVDCYDPADKGVSYGGQIAVTKSGYVCKDWDQPPQNPAAMSGYEDGPMFPDMPANYCRNPAPSGSRNKPWCYTDEPGVVREDCDVPQCGAQTTCIEGDGSTYLGTEAETTSGVACVSWTSQYSNYPELGDINYCRNPDLDPKGPWCNIAGGQGWGYCHQIPACPTYKPTYSDCTTDYTSGGNAWCFTDQANNEIGVCANTDHFTTKSVPCVFPVSYGGVAYSGDDGCIVTYEGETPWCFVADSDIPTQGSNWGDCKANTGQSVSGQGSSASSYGGSNFASAPVGSSTPCASGDTGCTARHRRGMEVDGISGYSVLDCATPAHELQLVGAGHALHTCPITTSKTCDEMIACTASDGGVCDDFIGGLWFTQASNLQGSMSSGSWWTLPFSFQQFGAAFSSSTQYAYVCVFDRLYMLDKDQLNHLAAANAADPEQAAILVQACSAGSDGISCVGTTYQYHMYLPPPDLAECYTSTDGSDYRGTFDFDVHGRVCQPWADQFPVAHPSVTPEIFPAAGLDGSLCRNPNGLQQPWCYVKDGDTRGCYNEADKGVTYTGTENVTINGHTCLPWNAQPYIEGSSNRSEVVQVTAGMYAGINYCRNPDGSDRPWCFTATEGVRWDYCNIPTCDPAHPLPDPTWGYCDVGRPLSSCDTAGASPGLRRLLASSSSGGSASVSIKSANPSFGKQDTQMVMSIDLASYDDFVNDFVYLGVLPYFDDPNSAEAAELAGIYSFNSRHYSYLVQLPEDVDWVNLEITLDPDFPYPVTTIPEIKVTNDVPPPDVADTAGLRGSDGCLVKMLTDASTCLGSPDGTSVNVSLAAPGLVTVIEIEVVSTWDTEPIPEAAELKTYEFIVIRSTGESGETNYVGEGGEEGSVGTSDRGRMAREVPLSAVGGYNGESVLAAHRRGDLSVGFQLGPQVPHTLAATMPRKKGAVFLPKNPSKLDAAGRPVRDRAEPHPDQKAGKVRMERKAPLAENKNPSGP